MSSFPKHSFEQAYDHAFPAGQSSEAHLQGRRSAAANADNQRHFSERSPLIAKAPLRTQPSYTYIDQPPGNRPYNKAPSATSASSVDTLLESGDAPDDHENQGSSCGDVSSCGSHLLSIRDLTVREFKILLQYSGPIVLTYSMQNSLQLASLLSLGHIGSIGKRNDLELTTRACNAKQKKKWLFLFSPLGKLSSINDSLESGLCFSFFFFFASCAAVVVFVISRHASIVPHRPISPTCLLIFSHQWLSAAGRRVRVFCRGHKQEAENVHGCGRIFPPNLKTITNRFFFAKGFFCAQLKGRRERRCGLGLVYLNSIPSA